MMGLVLSVTMLALDLWSSISLLVSVRGMWDHLDPGNSGVAHGISSFSFGLCGFMLSGKDGVRCSAVAGCVGWCGKGVHWCRALLCVAAVMFPLALPSPGEQAVPNMSQHGQQLLSCLAAALLHGCLHGLAAGRVLLSCCLLGACPPCWAHGGFPGKAKLIFTSCESCCGQGECEQAAACQALL